MHSVSDLGFQTNRAQVHIDIRHNSCSRVRAGSGQVQLLHVDLHRSWYRSHVHVYSFWSLASKIVSCKSTVINYIFHRLRNSLQLSLHLPASTLHQHFPEYGFLIVSVPVPARNQVPLPVQVHVPDRVSVHIPDSVSVHVPDPVHVQVYSSMSLSQCPCVCTCHKTVDVHASVQPHGLWCLWWWGVFGVGMMKSLPVNSSRSKFVNAPSFLKFFSFHGGIIAANWEPGPTCIWYGTLLESSG